MYFSLLFNEIKESFDPISQILEIFIKSNANLNLNDTKGNAVLHNLAFGGDENAVLMLINAGAEVNAKNVNGANALWCASFDGNLNKILVLLEHGAEVNLYSGGITPLHAATGWGVLLMNKERDDESFQEIKKKIEFSEESSLQMTKALVEAGADVYAHGYPADTDLTVLKWYEKLTLGRTPFEYAQAAGNKNVANYLKSVMKEQGKRWYWPF
jgi:ankyrin repeat protein